MNSRIACDWAVWCSYSLPRAWKQLQDNGGLLVIGNMAYPSTQFLDVAELDSTQGFADKTSHRRQIGEERESIRVVPGKRRR